MSDLSPANHNPRNSGSSDDQARQAVVSGLAKKIDRVFGKDVGTALAPVLIEAPTLDSESITGHLSTLARHGEIPRGVILRRGQTSQIERLVQDSRQELRVALGSEVHFLFANHASVEDAKWTGQQIRAVIAKDPAARYCFMLEGIVPAGMPADVPSLIRMFPNETTSEGTVTVFHDAVMNNFPNDALRAALFEHYTQTVKEIRGQDSTPMYRSRLGAFVFSLDVDSPGGTHDFKQWDGQFLFETSALAAEGVNFRIAFEEAPFEACVSLLKSDVLLTVARIYALHGRPERAVQALAFGILCQRDSSERRDESLVRQIQAQAAAHPTESIIVPRGISHHRAYENVEWSTKIRANSIIQPADEFDLYDLSASEDLARIVRTGQGEAQDRGRLGRILLSMELHAVLVSKYHVPIADSHDLIEISRVLSDDCGNSWLSSVVSHPHETHEEIFHETLQFLKQEGGAAAQPFVEQITGVIRRAASSQAES